MGCLDAVLEMRETWFYEGKGRGGGGSGRDCMGLCYRELCLQCRLIAVFSAGQSGTRWPPGKEQNQAQRAFHHEEGAPTLLFLMVASEHSASDESQSESPNCRGFS